MNNREGKKFTRIRQAAAINFLLPYQRYSVREIGCPVTQHSTIKIYSMKYVLVNSVMHKL